jgi:hypothetical protein
MKSRLFAVILFSLLFTSCFSVGSAVLPTPTEGFIPQKTYDKSFTDLWDMVQNILLTERMTITSQNKESKNIQTDYVQGSAQFQLGTVLNTRYKYSIIFESVSNKKITITIIGTLESSSKGHDWHDVSKDNSDQVMRMENWLYEKIENRIAQGGA